MLKFNRFNSKALKNSGNSYLSTRSPTTERSVITFIFDHDVMRYIDSSHGFAEFIKRVKCDLSGIMNIVIHHNGRIHVVGHGNSAKVEVDKYNSFIADTFIHLFQYQRQLYMRKLFMCTAIG